MARQCSLRFTPSCVVELREVYILPQVISLISIFVVGEERIRVERDPALYGRLNGEVGDGFVM